MIRRTNAFSLVEVTLAVGIVGFALLAIFGLLPVGMKSGKDAIDATRFSLIGQDAQNRVRSNVSYAMFAASSDVNFTWYYDGEGVFLGTNPSASALYRVDATVHGTWGGRAAPATLDASVLRAVSAEIRWPVNSTSGASVGPNKAPLTFYVRRP